MHAGYSNKVFHDTIMSVTNVGVARRIIKPLVAVGYFDESGKWKDSDGVFVFAGFVGFPPFIEKLTTAWGERLSADKISHSSMKDAVNYHGCFAHLKNSPEVRDRVLRDLALMFVEARSTMLMVRSSLERATLEGFHALPKKDQDKFGGNPYYAAFESCILGALDSRSDILLHTVCDLAEEYSEKCVKAFHKMRKRNSVVKNRAVGLAFSDDTWAPPLQLADMLAFCARAEALKMAGTKEPQPIVSELIEILQPPDAEEHHVLYRLQGELGGSGEGVLE
jgi:hypothetical protein